MSGIANIKEAVFKKEVLKKLNRPEFKNTDLKKTIEDNYALNAENDAYILAEGLNANTTNKIVSILKTVGFVPFDTLDEVVNHIKSIEKKYTLLFAYNGTGKTRLSMKFRELSKTGDNKETLYFNAFTEDLFTWDNDLDDDTHRVLLLNRDSKFFGSTEAEDDKSLIESIDIANRIRPLLKRYADFNFDIDYKYKKPKAEETGDETVYWAVNFIREELVDGTAQNKNFIKVSRGEENIFIWCFFVAIAQLAIDGDQNYEWVKYIYIDDPISSLDDNNTIAVASHLARLLKENGNNVKVIISSHHTLFFNVMCNELKNGQKYFLSKLDDNKYKLTDTTDTPFFHHVSLIRDLHNAVESGKLYSYHFNILRSILEKTASFHGFANFSDCIKPEADDENGIIYTRMINILSHGNYSLYEPTEMLPENKQHFKKILRQFLKNYKFNPEIVPEIETETVQE
jgi:hypothetical protein